MSESEKPFTIKDRRHFTPDGDVREGPEAAESEAAEPEASSGSPSPSGDEPGPVDPSPAPDPPESPPADEAPRDAGTDTDTGEGFEPAAGAPGGPVDLGQFLFSLGAQASMLLTGQGLPEGADPTEALAGARSIISIIEMLEKKTEGNRTPEESQVLEGLLYELRMAYLERSRGGGS